MKKFSLLAFFFCCTMANAQVQEFKWLVGTWQEQRKAMFEEWVEDSLELKAEGYEVTIDGTKKVSETMRLIKRGADFYYVPNVPHNQKPIEFKITSVTETGFVAENLFHDFPKKIVYNKTGPTTLLATISGGAKSVSYSFQKIK